MRGSSTAVPTVGHRNSALAHFRLRYILHLSGHSLNPHFFSVSPSFCCCFFSCIFPFLFVFPIFTVVCTHYGFSCIFFVCFHGFSCFLRGSSVFSCFFMFSPCIRAWPCCFPFDILILLCASAQGAPPRAAARGGRGNRPFGAKVPAPPPLCDAMVETFSRSHFCISFYFWVIILACWSLVHLVSAFAASRGWGRGLSSAPVSWATASRCPGDSRCSHAGLTIGPG